MKTGSRDGRPERALSVRSRDLRRDAQQWARPPKTAYAARLGIHILREPGINPLRSPARRSCERKAVRAAALYRAGKIRAIPAASTGYSRLVMGGALRLAHDAPSEASIRLRRTGFYSPCTRRD